MHIRKSILCTSLWFVSNINYPWERNYPCTYCELTFMPLVVNSIDPLCQTNQTCLIFGLHRRRSYRLGGHLLDLLISFHKHYLLWELFVCMSLSEVLGMFSMFYHIHRNADKQQPCLYCIVLKSKQIYHMVLLFLRPNLNFTGS